MLTWCRCSPPLRPHARRSTRSVSSRLGLHARLAAAAAASGTLRRERHIRRPGHQPSVPVLCMTTLLCCDGELRHLRPESGLLALRDIWKPQRVEKDLQRPSQNLRPRDLRHWESNCDVRIHLVGE